VELLYNLLVGFEIAFSGQALLFCFIGVTVGTVVGVLPGIGALTAISMVLPLTFYLEPTLALIMLAGIFYGAQYGSSIAAILMNIPGTATAAVPCLDGYPMTKQGRAGVALFITTISSYLGGTFAILLLIVFAQTLSRLALNFGPPEYFSIMVLGLVAASTIGVGSPLKGLASVVVGLALGLVGTDVYTGQLRFTFGILELTDGVSLVALAMGLFGVAEILASIDSKHQVLIDPKTITLRSLMPTWSEMRQSFGATARGSLVGSWVGALPGTGPTIATFMAYALEKKVAKDPSRFGRGAIEGISAPEAANNASVQAAFIPTLSLGVPGDAIMAILLGAMMIHGITPGPQFIVENPTIFWGLVASFWIGNIMLLILNIPLIGLWVRLLAIPYNVLYLAMLFFICIGVFSVQNSAFDVLATIVFGVLGYFMIALRYSAAALLLGFILGPLIEEHFRRALLISRGDFLVFVDHPLSAVFLALTVLLLLLSSRKALLLLGGRARRRTPRSFEDGAPLPEESAN